MLLLSQTLMDTEKRAAYDAIAGFSGGAVNPFHDTSYERSQVSSWCWCPRTYPQHGPFLLPPLLLPRMFCADSQKQPRGKSQMVTGLCAL